jgi:hypothetical protein
VEIANSNWDISKVHLHADAQAERTHRVGVYLEFAFAEPTIVPFPSYGHSAHFGLGQFEPVEGAHDLNQRDVKA